MMEKTSNKLFIGQPGTQHIRWLNPVELFEHIRLPEMIKQMVFNREATFKRKARNKKAK